MRSGSFSSPNTSPRTTIECGARLYHGSNHAPLKIQYARLEKLLFDRFNRREFIVAARIITEIVERQIKLDICHERIDVTGVECYAKDCHEMGTGFMIVTAFTWNIFANALTPVTIGAINCGKKGCRKKSAKMLKNWNSQKWAKLNKK